MTSDQPRGEFWVTPQAIGPVPKAGVDLFAPGEKIAEIRTPIQVRSMVGSWIFFGLAGFFLLMAPVLEFLERNLGEHSTMGFLVNAMGGPVACGIILSVLSFIGGALWFFWANPSEGRPISVSLSHPAAPDGGLEPE
jgi:hypothetical protein